MSKSDEYVRIEKYTLPVHWAGPLINGDYSGLSDEEGDEIDNWLIQEQPGRIVDVSEEFAFSHSNDATNVGVSVATFTFHGFTYADLRHHYTISRNGDPWGHCMATLFSICDVLHARSYENWRGRAEVTAAQDALDSWEFRKGGNGQPDIDEEAQWFTGYSTFDLVRFGNVLNKLSERLTATGRSY